MHLQMSYSNQRAVPSILLFLLLLSLLRKPSAGAKWMDQILVLILLPSPQRAQQRKKIPTSSESGLLFPLSNGGAKIGLWEEGSDATATLTPALAGHDY